MDVYSMCIYTACMYIYIYIHVYIYIYICHMYNQQQENEVCPKMRYHWSQKIGPFVRSMHPAFLLENLGECSLI